jgi:hypothetical protein
LGASELDGHEGGISVYDIEKSIASRSRPTAAAIQDSAQSTRAARLESTALKAKVESLETECSRLKSKEVADRSIINGQSLELREAQSGLAMANLDAELASKDCKSLRERILNLEEKVGGSGGGVV